MEDLLTKDGHRLTVSFACAVAIVDEPAERKLFDEVFTSQRSATRAAVTQHFAPALRSAALEMAADDPAEVLLGAPARSKWTKALQSAANEVGFMCGLAVLAPFEVEVTSPTVQRERLEQMQRIAAERRSADRVGHFARAAELLKQWEALKADVPSITPGKLLEQVNPADRGMMLDTLLMAGAGTMASQPDLWAVSGPYLVRIDVKGESPQSKLIALPATAGPLRSVRAQNGKLLIGARSGVLIVDPANPDGAQDYHHPALVSEHGFTSVTTIGDQLWACHREGGLVGWKIGSPNEPLTILSSKHLGGEAKNLIATGLFSVGTQLFKLSPTEFLFKAGSPIVAVLSMEDQILVASESGTIVLLDAVTLEKTTELQTTGKLTGAALLPWLSASRLLLNRAEGPIECIGLEDQLVTQFTAGHTGMRSVTACIGKVAAMSSDRQRVLLWNALGWPANRGGDLSHWHHPPSDRGRGVRLREQISHRAGRRRRIERGCRRSLPHRVRTMHNASVEESMAWVPSRHHPTKPDTFWRKTRHEATKTRQTRQAQQSAFTAFLNLVARRSHSGRSIRRSLRL